MMGSDPPNQQLVISGNVHNVPSPHTPTDEPLLQSHSNSPEPLSEEDIIRMRNRVADLGLSFDAMSQNKHTFANLTLKEKELGGMVVKLLQSSVEPAQLHQQAEFITWLKEQRDFLVHSFEEERQRWEAEREGWTRMAEALLSQRARAANSSREEEEVERQCAVYESENKNLREKLQEAHSRFSALESELNRLKPLLFMQPPSPFVSASTETTSVAQANPASESGSSTLKRKTSNFSVFEENGKGSLSGTLKDPETPRSQPRPDHYRRYSHSRSFLSPSHSQTPYNSTPARSIFSATQSSSTHPHSSKKSRSKSKKFHSNLPPLAADARTEHLLLAARKIGRERANAVSGLMRRIEKEKEDMTREREAECMDRMQLDRSAEINLGNNTYYRRDLLDLVKSQGSSATSAIPKTPKRGTNGAPFAADFMTPTLVAPHSDIRPPTSQTPNSFVFVGAPAPIVTAYQGSSASTPRPVTSTASTMHSTANLAQTPAGPSTSTHPTPLASLLSAAKSMMDDESHDSNSTHTGRRRVGVPEPPESPLPKRRRVGNGSTSNGKGVAALLGEVSTPTSDRVRSALDVLADQAAAAFDSDWQTPTRPPTRPPTKVALRNKGKERGAHSRSALPSEEVFNDDLTANGSTNLLHGSPSHARTGSLVSTRSRSKALFTDRLSKGASNVSPVRKKDKSLNPQQRSAPAPRMIFSPGTRSPISPPSPPSTLSPTPLSAVASDIATTTPVCPGFETAAESLVDDGSPLSPNGATSGPFYPPVSPRILQESVAKSLSPSSTTEWDTRESQPDTGTAQADDQASVAKNPIITSEAVIDKSHDQNEGRARSHSSDGKKEREDRSEGAGVQLHSDRVHFIPDDDGPDTDADAEGEVDMDVEGTVILNLSSMTHEPLSLAVTQSCLGTAHSISVEMANNENTSGMPQG